jgi:Domain of unknown function (DUF4388)
MSLPSHLDGLAAVGRAVLANDLGEVVDATDDHGWRPDQDASAAAVALAELEAVGASLGLTGLDLLLVKGTTRSTVSTRRPGGVLLVEIAAGQRSADVEKALKAWSAAAGSSVPVERPGTPPAAPPPVSVPASPAETVAVDAWAALRRALSRGHLNEAAVLLRAVDAAPDPTRAPSPEVGEGRAVRPASQRLLEGVGRVLAGDTAGGARILLDLAGPGQEPVSLRWLAAHWLARAALVGGSVDVTRRHVKDAIDLSRKLDVAARAMSQLLAAELLLRAGEHDKALAWLAEARSRFERVADTWGEARAWLVEARVRATTGDDEGCAQAARRAGLAEPAWDGPLTFLAGRALASGDLHGAETLLADLESVEVSLVRRLVAAVRQGSMSREDATEFLRLHHSPPTTTTMRALERIADASPRVLVVREALAWMLVKLGRYEAARGLFAWLLAQPLDEADRAPVTMGLRCAEAALRPGTPSAAPAPPAAVGAAPPLTDSVLLPRALGGGTADSDAVFAGRLSVFTLPDLIEFLRSARRSGLLVCSAPAGVGTMRFCEGYITGASAPGTPSAGELLLRSGQLSTEALRLVTSAPEGSEAAEASLLRDGLVAPMALEAAVRQQVELALRELVRWSDGEFVFNKDSAGGPAGGRVLVDAQELLLNLFKEMDEATRAPVVSGSGG